MTDEQRKKELEAATMAVNVLNRFCPEHSWERMIASIYYDWTDKKYYAVVFEDNLNHVERLTGMKARLIESTETADSYGVEYMGVEFRLLKSKEKEEEE